ncbi:MAG: sulfatase-like hydrolase/transferase, partial [Acidobacteriota bacterium]|nr:sulfatase-like hydrolase/transferase [Acidobacteriota bacterium]
RQFLQPQLVPSLAWFARYWPAAATVTGAMWLAPRVRPWSQPHVSTWAAAIVWGAAAIAGWAGFSLAALAPGDFALACALAASLMLLPIAIAEQPDGHAAAGEARPHMASDFVACLLAAFVLTIIDAAIGLTDQAPATAASMWLVVRGPLLAGMVIFLVLTLVRGLASFFGRPVVAEARGTVVALGLLFGWFIGGVMLTSISIAGPGATAAGHVAGLAVALAITTRGARSLEVADDGVASVLGSLAPRFAARLPGFALWFLLIAALAYALNRVTHTADWNAVGARLGILIVFVLALGGAKRLVRMPGDGQPAVFLGLALIVLAAHAGVARLMTPEAMRAGTPASRWVADLLAAGSGEGSSELYNLLPGHTNIPRSLAVAPVPIVWSELSGAPAAERPNIFVLVVDSLRRDYLSPYNPAVNFTPSIQAFSKDNLVFTRAFTQYGATGLSVPSIWLGGPLLHKQYIEPFAPMNALARLLTHEQYQQWISMDNVMRVILPPTTALDPLDGQVLADFRLCDTLEEIRGRLRERPSGGAPVFAYSLPQDIHVSLIAREGTGAVDGESYDGFYAPVASRVRRLDACFGAFVDELKARGLYDRSIVILTSDHGDSLGEDGRMGHAFTLYPEIVRVPLIVHVPAAMRERYAWDPDRPAFTTDLTPTLFRLLGHDPVPPQPFFGESLAVVPGEVRPTPRDRMLAASYGSVYGALLDGATRLYVADAIQRREMAFTIGDGAVPGSATEVTPAIRRQGGDLIRATVDAIARQYRFSPPPR